MQILNKIADIKRLQVPLAIALGNFDGVHRGHQALLHQCVEESQKNFWFSAVLLWNPHPVVVLQGEHKVKFLNTAAQKYQLIQSLGIQYLFLLPFDTVIASLSPLEFVQTYLVNFFQVKKVFVGFNYSFGQKGDGTPEMLKKLSKQNGFAVSVIKPVSLGNEIISSSLIRQKLGEGDISGASSLLGYYPVLEGKVVSGEQRGSRMGFPTANIEIPEQQLLPSFGVYAAYAAYQETLLPAIVNIGIKPTFGNSKVTVEVYIFDFHKDIYKQDLKIHLLQKIRPEQKFRNKDELITQINCDVEKAYQLFKNNKLKKSNISFAP
jgi:riboflavin kinase/FMN adenylyltransferase